MYLQIKTARIPSSDAKREDVFQNVGCAMGKPIAPTTLMKMQKFAVSYLFNTSITF